VLPAGENHVEVGGMLGGWAHMKLALFRDERRTSNIERPTSNETNHKNCFGEAPFQSLTIAKQCGLLFWYSTSYDLYISYRRRHSIVLYHFSFDVSRLGGIGRSMFDVHS
jgi:hypothetical protein